MAKKNYIGLRYGKLVIVKEIGVRRKYNRVFECICDCGKTTTVCQSYLSKDMMCGCGCLKKKPKKHGLSYHPLYKVWNDIKMRCYNKNRASYKNYGGRGVKMCDEWRNNPEAFVKWGIKNGWKPGFEIDKDMLGDNKLYSPENCVFLTPKMNSKYKRNTKYVLYDNKKMTLVDLSELLDIKYSFLYYHLFIQKKDINELIKNRKSSING